MMVLYHYSDTMIVQYTYILGLSNKYGLYYYTVGMPVIDPIPDLKFAEGSNISIDVNIRFINGGPMNRNAELTRKRVANHDGTFITCNNVCTIPNDVSDSLNDRVHYRPGPTQLNVTITDASNVSDTGEYRAEALYSDGTLVSTVSATFSVEVTPTSSTPTFFTSSSVTTSVTPLPGNVSYLYHVSSFPY